MSNFEPFLIQIGKACNDNNEEEKQQAFQRAMTYFSNLITNASRCVYDLDIPIFIACLERFCEAKHAAMSPEQLDVLNTVKASIGISTITVKLPPRPSSD